MLMELLSWINTSAFQNVQYKTLMSLFLLKWFQEKNPWFLSIWEIFMSTLLKEIY